MEYEVIHGESLTVIGTTIRTTNAEAAQTIGQAWHQFFEQGMLGRIPNRVDEHAVWGIYTDYASNENDDYTFMVGAPVTGSPQPPKGMELRELPAQRFAKVDVRGAIPEVVQATWEKVYGSNLPRSFTVDVEKFDTRRMGPQAEVEFLIGLT